MAGPEGSLIRPPPPPWLNTLTATGPPDVRPPAATLHARNGVRARAARLDAKIGSNLLVAAAVLHGFAIFFVLVTLKGIADAAAQRNVSWGELLYVLERAGFLPLVVTGVFVQLFFAIVAGMGAFLLRMARPQVAIPLIVVGVVAVVFSFALFGGIVGAIGGGLMAAGGAKGRSRPPIRWAYSQTTYGPPPDRP